MKFYRLLPAVGLAFLLNGCASQDLNSTLRQGAKKLGSGQVRELVDGSSVQLAGYGQEATVEFNGDGTMVGTNTSGGKDKGVWQVKGDELCLRFKKWAEGDGHCYQVVGDGSAYQLFSHKGMMIYGLTVLTPGAREESSGAAAAPPTAAGSDDHRPTAEAEPAPIAETMPITPQVAADITYLVRQRAQNCPGCNLAGTNLAGQTLVGANLQGANLAEADLSNANLRRANLKGANLYRANLKGADLAGADLTGANLTEAIRE